MVSMRTRIRRTRSDAGSWELAKAPPRAGLEDVVRGYTGWIETSASPLRRREAPSGTAVLIVNLGAPLEVGAPGRPTATHAGSFLARVSELPATTEFTGTSAGVQVDFTPLGSHLFCGLPLDEIPDPAVDLADILGAEGTRLTAMLADASDWESRFDLLDATIARRLAAARAPTPSVEWAWGALEASGGRLEVGRLAARIGCSSRHLIAGFREQVGVTPKAAARILRFERAARLVTGARELGLARIASDCGYCDQPHMTREFRALAALTPAAYRAASRPGQLGIADGPCA